MRGTVVFDLDYTLIDTASFKAELAVAGDPDAVLSGMAQFVFDDALPVLERLKADGWRLALLTKGDPAWQERKAAESGLLGFFDFTLFTREPKVECLEAFARWPGPLVFVNDDGPEIDALASALPDALILGFHGPKPLPTAQAVPMFSTLEGVYNRLTEEYLQELRNS